MLQASDNETSLIPYDINGSGEESITESRTSDKLVEINFTFYSFNSSEDTLIIKLVKEVDWLKKNQCNNSLVINRTTQWYGILALLAQTILSFITLAVVIIAKCKPAQPYHSPTRETQLLLLDKPMGRRDHRRK